MKLSKIKNYLLLSMGILEEDVFMVGDNLIIADTGIIYGYKKLSKLKNIKIYPFNEGPSLILSGKINFDFIEKARNIDSLCIENSLIKDLTPLLSLKALKYLSIENCPNITKEEIDKIYDELKCRIECDLGHYTTRTFRTWKEKTRVRSKSEIIIWAQNNNFNPEDIISITGNTIKKWAIKGKSIFCTCLYENEDFYFESFCDLEDEDIVSLEFFKELYELEHLSLAHNNISNVEDLANLTNLESLDLSYNKITDISPLFNLTNLKNLKIKRNSLRSSQIQDLKLNLPNCIIEV